MYLFHIFPLDSELHQKPCVYSSLVYLHCLPLCVAHSGFLVTICGMDEFIHVPVGSTLHWVDLMDIQRYNQNIDCLGLSKCCSLLLFGWDVSWDICSNDTGKRWEEAIKSPWLSCKQSRIWILSVWTITLWEIHFPSTPVSSPFKKIWQWYLSCRGGYED